MENWMVSIVAAAVGATLKPIGEYIVGILKYHFGEMRVRRLPRRWQTTWSYRDVDEYEEGTDVVEIKQLGPFIWGHASGEKSNYDIKAKLYPDGTIEGSWKTSQTGSFWFGNFCLLVDLEGRTIIGKWAGKLGKDPGKIRGGDWIWKAK